MPVRPNSKPGSAVVRVSVALKVGGERLKLDLPAPAGPARLAELLPVIHDLTDDFVRLGTRDSEAQGRAISCRKGCGACCRQLVPIAPDEARQIARLVDRLPEPRRSAVRARFDEARRRLADAGLLEALTEPDDDPPTSLGLDYFREAIPCPFLEDESCSIHPDRPSSCREYLVTSPAENCSAPSAGTIDRVAIPAKVSTALFRVSGGPAPAVARWVPLILAPSWAEAHPEGMPRRPGPEWLLDLFRRLAGGAAAPE